MIHHAEQVPTRAGPSRAGDPQALPFLTTFPAAEPPHWRNDELLHDLDPGRYDLITLDVFDTLLLRRCRRPDEVFLRLGQRLIEQGLLREGLSSEAFRMARIDAEAAARARRQRTHGDPEVDLAEIHSGLSGLVRDVDASAALEFAVENEMVLANPVLRSCLESARAAGKPVRLLSDMYLGSARILALLKTAGIGPDSYDELLVSSDLKVAKHDGSLFRLLLDRPGTPAPGRILHIGDHPVADGSVPAALGIHTLLYSAITGPEADLFANEQVHSPGLLPEIASLRRALWRQLPSAEPRRRFWHRFGCCVLGPLLGAYADWVVTTCRQSGIQRVVALMRDGHTLMPLIQRAAQARGVDLQVVPGWLSRRSVFFGAQPAPTAQSLGAWFELDSITIGGLFALLGLAEVPSGLRPWTELYLCQCACQRTEDGRDVRALLLAHLTSAGILERVESFIGQQRELLMDYLDQLAGGARQVAFVDIGYSGTIGRAIHDALGWRGAGPGITHLFGIGHLSLGRHLAAGMDVRCYAGGFGQDWGIIQRTLRSSAFLEELLLGNHGSAIGYERQADGTVAAVCAPPDLPLAELQCKSWCQEGMAQWQAARVQADRCGPPVGPAPAGLLKLLLRSVELPTAEEARFIGEITHDYGSGGGSRRRLCPDEAAAMLAGSGPRLFLEQTASTYYLCGVPWPEGTVTRAEPYFLMERALRHGDGENGLSNEFLAPALRLFEEKPGPCLIYGASQQGRQAARLLRLLGVPMAGFLDRNPALWGTDLGGVRVHSPEEARTLAFEAVLIGSILYAASIAHDIHSGILGNRPGLQVYSPFPASVRRLERWVT